MIEISYVKWRRRKREGCKERFAVFSDRKSVRVCVCVCWRVVEIIRRSWGRVLKRGGGGGGRYQGRFLVEIRELITRQHGFIECRGEWWDHGRDALPWWKFFSGGKLRRRKVISWSFFFFFFCGSVNRKWIIYCEGYFHFGNWIIVVWEIRGNECIYVYIFFFIFFNLLDNFLTKQYEWKFESWS